MKTPLPRLAASDEASNAIRDIIARFPSCAFYDCDDGCESLSYEILEEAIAVYVEGGDSVSTEDRILAVTPLEVYCYDREELNPRFAELQAGSAIEEAKDAWLDEYGGPCGENELPAEALRKAEQELEVVFRKLFESGKVWNCKIVKTVTLTADEVRTVLKQYIPEIFDET